MGVVLGMLDPQQAGSASAGIVQSSRLPATILSGTLAKPRHTAAPLPPPGSWQRKVMTSRLPSEGGKFLNAPEAKCSP